MSKTYTAVATFSVEGKVGRVNNNYDLKNAGQKKFPDDTMVTAGIIYLNSAYSSRTHPDEPGIIFLPMVMPIYSVRLTNRPSGFYNLFEGSTSVSTGAAFCAASLAPIPYDEQWQQIDDLYYRFLRSFEYNPSNTDRFSFQVFGGAHYEARINGYPEEKKITYSHGNSIGDGGIGGNYSYHYAHTGETSWSVYHEAMWQVVYGAGINEESEES